MVSTPQGSNQAGSTEGKASTSETIFSITNSNESSQSVGSAGLTTGIIGTALGAINSGLLGGNGLFGGVSGGASSNYVSRETFDLSMQLASSQRDNAILTADLASEKKMVEIYNSLNDKINTVVNNQTAINSAQAVTNCAVTSQLAVANNNIAQLMAMTKLVIPNASVSPGWSTTT